MMAIMTKTFSLFMPVCTLFLRTGFIIVQTWIQILSTSIFVQVDAFWKIMVWALAIVSLPLRIFKALQRERILETLLGDMQMEMQDAVRHMKEFEKRLQAAARERQLMESMLMELEDELDKAYDKIELLESELQDLKADNNRPKDIQTSKSIKDDGVENQNASITESPLKMEVRGSAALNKIKNKSTTDLSTLLRAACGSINGILEQRREVALYQSVFSAALSLVVGVTIWEAEDPCMSLVVALFIVVGMSSRSVTKFLSTILHKPAPDAVALLCLNWFVLGSLTYPTLPRIARMLATPAARFWAQILGWFGVWSRI